MPLSSAYLAVVNQRAHLLRRWIVPAWLLAGLTVAIYFEVQMTAHFHPHSRITFTGLEDLGKAELWQAWRSRVLAIVPAQQVVEFSLQLPSLPNKLDHPLGPMVRGVGLCT